MNISIPGAYKQSVPQMKQSSLFVKRPINNPKNNPNPNPNSP